jgi:hypothetical protein
MLLSIAPGAGPWNPFGCSDMALFDIISTHEITVNIIHLITIYITMIVGAGTDFGW